MPRKKGDGKITSIEGGKGKKRPAVEEDLKLPSAFLRTKVGPRSIQSGSYQRRLLAIFAPVLGPALLNSLHRNLKIGDSRAQGLVAEILGMTSKSGPVVKVNVNQSNNNNARAESASISQSKSASSPDEIYPMLASEREQRRSLAPASIPIDLEATPVNEEPMIGNED